MHFQQCPSLRSRLSQGGYITESAELDKEIFDHTTLSRSFSKPTYFEMGINFGTDNSAAEFLSLPPPVNPWTPPQPETQVALLGNPHQSADDRLLVSMHDHSLANTLASFRTEMTSVVTTMMAVNEKERAKGRQV